MQNTTPQPAPAKAKRPQVVPPPEFQAAKIMAMQTPELVAILKDASSTTFQKGKACMRLAMVGTKEAVPAIAPLLNDEQLGHYARFALGPLPDPSADDALRAALRTTKGQLLVGVIDTIGQRKDRNAVQPLTPFLYGTDAELAKATAAAIGLISGPQATATLRAALVKTKGPVRSAVADAALVCAEGLLAQSDRKGALALYSTLAGSGMPRTVRQAAMHSTLLVETSLSRPRTPPAAAK